MSENMRFIEELHKEHFSMKYQIDEVLFKGQSEFQKVEVVKTKGHGKMLLNDGLVMVSERDEFIYHDMIAHVPLFVHPEPKKVLIVGGGDGGTAREVLRHETVEECWMVEIDGMVVEACRQHLPLTASELNHPKLRLKIEDGVKFMAETDEKFDVILIDSTDPIGPATPLFGEEFYKNVSQRLNKQGIVVAQGESPFYETAMQKKLLSIVGGIFPIHTYYNFNNMTYPGGLWSFLFASKDIHPLRNFRDERVKHCGIEFKYYNEQIHRASFALPEFMKKTLEGLISLD